MFCAKCGSEIAEDVQFCGKCGTPVKRDSRGDIQTGKEPEKEVPDRQPDIRAAGGQNGAKKDRSGKKWLIAALAAGVIMIAVCMAVLLGKGNSKGGNSNEWIGYEAELASGLRVKTACYTYKSSRGEDIIDSITYDPEGNILKVTGSSDFFWEAVESEAGLFFYKWGHGSCMEKEYVHFSKGSYEFQGNTVTRCSDGTTWVYAENGAVLSVTYKTEEGSRTLYYKYDEQGRLIETNENAGDSSYIFKYEKDLELSEVLWRETRYEKPTTLYKYSRDYDTDGNLIQLLEYKTDTYQNLVLREIFNYEYDEAGNRVSFKRTTGYGADTEDYYEKTEMWRYDAAGNMIEYCEYCTVGEVIYITNKYELKYVYDTAGNVTEIETFKLLFPGGYTYNESGPKKYIWYKESDNSMRLIEKVECEHSKNGIKSRVTSYSYEANADHSVINLAETAVGDWKEANYVGPSTGGKGYYIETDRNHYMKVADLTKDYIEPDTEHGYWTITYYTEEEIEKYWHDKEFERVN